MAIFDDQRLAQELASAYNRMPELVAALEEAEQRILKLSGHDKKNGAFMTVYDWNPDGVLK